MLLSNRHNFLKICALVFLLAMVGCATSLNYEEKNSSLLMPSSVARYILKKYNIEDRIDIKKMHVNVHTCRSGPTDFHISELTKISFFMRQKGVWLERRESFFCVTVVSFSVETEQDAKEILIALRALGALKLEEITTIP